MNGVRFGTKHSYDDFGLILSSKNLSFPEPKIETVSVIGRDGDIDLSDALGDDVKFKNRKLTFTFTVPNGLSYWSDALSTLSNYLHGQKMSIALDEDKAFYYYGRCKINQYKSNKRMATIVVECDVGPYKMEVNGAGMPWVWDTFSFINGIIHLDQITVSGSKTVNLINRRKVVSPTFICSAAVKVTFNGNVYTLPAGRTTVYDIRLKEGNNNVTIAGNATVEIEYRGGSL